MFGSSALDVAIGLAFLYLLLSLLCTAVNEVLEAAVQKRGEYLRDGIAELLSVAPDVPFGNWFSQLLSWFGEKSRVFALWYRSARRIARDAAQNVQDVVSSAQNVIQAAEDATKAVAEAAKRAQGAGAIPEDVTAAEAAFRTAVGAARKAAEMAEIIERVARNATEAARRAKLADPMSAATQAALATAARAAAAALAAARSAADAADTVVKGAADEAEQVKALAEAAVKNAPPDLLDRVYKHPFIASLYSGKYGTATVRLPSYIPARQFALALLDLVMPAGKDTKSGAAFATGAEKDSAAVAEHITKLRAAVAALGPGVPKEVKTALLALIDAAGNDFEKIRDGIEKWYDGTMDRVAGWYRRRVQYVSVAAGAIMAVVLNADTFAISDALARDQTLRTTVSSAAENYAKTHTPPTAPPNQKATQEEKDAQAAKDVKDALGRVSDGVNDVRGFGWPLGWDFRDDRTIPESPWKSWRAVGAWFIKALGWLLTAAAISLGAPLWFDTLNRIIVVRSTVKPTEKSPEEPSADKK